VFRTAARLGSFSATATELGVSPAYVTKRIAILEKRLRIKLFHRTSRRVAVTDEGETIYGWLECQAQDNRCVLIMPTLGIKRVLVPDPTIEPAWPWQSWVEHYLKIFGLDHLLGN